MSRYDLAAIKKDRVINSKEQVTESGVWYHLHLQEYQGYVVLDDKRKYIVTAVTDKFLTEDPSPDALLDQLYKHVEDFQKRKTAK